MATNNAPGIFRFSTTTASEAIQSSSPQKLTSIKPSPAEIFATDVDGDGKPDLINVLSTATCRRSDTAINTAVP